MIQAASMVTARRAACKLARSSPSMSWMRL
jgi:hypothetical protein